MANLFAVWNSGSTFDVDAAEVAAEATPARLCKMLEALERAANGREGRWMIALALGSGEFSLGSVW